MEASAVVAALLLLLAVELLDLLGLNLFDGLLILVALFQLVDDLLLIEDLVEVLVPLLL